MDRHGPPALFDDRHTDTRMRRTVPEFAVLGAVLVAMTTPYLVPTPDRRLAVLGLSAAAVALAFATWVRGHIDRMQRGVLWALLSSYCVLIALVVAATDDAATPYRLLYSVPVVFTATFFTGWLRYSLAVVAPVLEWAVTGRVLPLGLEGIAGRAVMWLFLAHFGGVVADTLRESLRAMRSFHAVLEAASGAPLATDLADIGLDAALSIVGWSQGTVLLLDADTGVLRHAASRGTSAELVASYQSAPRRVTDSGVLGDVCRTGESTFLPDVRQRYEAGHLLVDAGLRSVALLPLVHHGELLGVLMVCDDKVRRFDEQLRSQLEGIAGQVALAMGSAIAYRRQTEVSARLLELNRRKDEFLANVSHELRTPAATIKLVAATLRTNATRITGDQQAEMYETLERRSSHLVELIESLLEQAVAEAGVTRLTSTSIDWREAVVRWAEIAQLQTGRDITLHVPAGAVIGAGDAVKLERVVANLLSNAAKFSPAGSPITLALRADAQWVEVEVRDEGVGIPEGDVERIFDRFQQLDAGATRTAGGFGIGLSLVRHFVEAHGGTVTVQSTVGEGSRFTVRVPRTQPTGGEGSEPRYAQRKG
jgi:signal transduction histidine kinase